ncbi:magnesium transporter [Neptunomonas antarctica]|uniref:Magnesium transporter n=1 Tax=Neptunomonas antarctica TaxID=619304 RepID=A0A1N7N3C6_9GAMM|nr:magnesium transporter [Neptunomonas antarctica]SIS92835.1 magnesium transporter [Neptunomonas antarctica]
MADDIGPLVDRIVKSDADGVPADKEALLDQLEDLEFDQWALLLEALPIEERIAQWQLIPDDMKAEVLVEMRADARLSVINALPTDVLEQLFGHLTPEDLIELADSLPDHLIDLALRQMGQKQRQFFEHSNQFNENQIGRYADHNLLILPQNAKVYDALRLFRRDIPECTDALFLTDRAGRYAGTVPLKSTFGAPGHISLVELMDEHAKPLPAETSLEESADIQEKSDYVLLPIVDSKGMLIGRMTIKDGFQILRENHESENMARAGLSEDEDLFSPVWKSSMRRATWLGINLLTAFLASWAIGLFEATLQQVVALAVLMPIVASMGGIAGSQTLTLIIRGIALGQISKGNLTPLLLKELAVGGFNGVLWALAIGGIVAYWFSDLMIGVVIAVAIALNILAAAFSGVLIPVILDKMKIDPALSGSVILTTVTDVVGFVTFLGLGTLFLI